MLERILLAAGYRVGLYTSPHLLRYNERVRINGVAVDDDGTLRRFCPGRAGARRRCLTYFEFGTLAAWEVFAAAKLDAIILEVGLGGRLDATNAYHAPDCSIVTGIDLDHMDYLGPDRESIGPRKGRHFPLRHSGNLRRSAAAAIPARACGADRRRVAGHGPRFRLSAAGAAVAVLGRAAGEAGGVMRRGGLAFPALRGERQLANAACALAALDALSRDLPVAMKDIRRGLIEVELPGRFQVLPGRRPWCSMWPTIRRRRAYWRPTWATWVFIATHGRCSACSPTRTSMG
jgi:dihydrofolate synthase/folylpolyglutamate synthase